MNLLTFIVLACGAFLGGLAGYNYGVRKGVDRTVLDCACWVSKVFTILTIKDTENKKQLAKRIKHEALGMAEYESLKTRFDKD